MSILSRKEKLAYGLGDFGASLVFQSQLAFLLFFYTDVFGIAAATAGTILLISRIIDALSDPVIGAIADRSESRWGKYRPWILWTALPLAAASILCFTTPPLSPTGKVFWAIVTTNVLMILYAANNIPYCALSAVMTDDTTQRTSLQSSRFICMICATFVVSSFTVKLVDWFGDNDRAYGYRAAMTVWGTIAAVCFLVAFAFTRERVAVKSKKQSSLRQDLIGLFRSGPWIALFAIAVLIHIQLQLRSGAMLYYFTHFLERENLFGWFNGVGLAAAVIGIVVANPLAQALGKRNAFQLCLLLSAVLIALFALLPRDWLRALFALQILFQLVFGPTIPLLWTMMADVADYSEWKTGRQSTALAFASIVFGMKLGLGIASWLSGEWLEFVGYSQSNGQSSAAIRGIVMLVSVFPAAALMMGSIALFAYPINDRLERQMREGLRVRRETRSWSS
jgi:GPH family glycoside/pentoside/hexuronide:cation symporter